VPFVSPPCAQLYVPFYAFDGGFNFLSLGHARFPCDPIRSASIVLTIPCRAQKFKESPFFFLFLWLLKSFSPHQSFSVYFPLALFWGPLSSISPCSSSFCHPFFCFSRSSLVKSFPPPYLLFPCRTTPSPGQFLRPVAFLLAAMEAASRPIIYLDPPSSHAVKTYVFPLRLLFCWTFLSVLTKVHLSLMTMT